MAKTEKASSSWRPAPWLADYDKTWLRTDAVAGVTVWALLVPQALAYGQLTGLPAVHGLYAALGALALYALYGTSRHLNVGPEATVLCGNCGQAVLFNARALGI